MLIVLEKKEEKTIEIEWKDELKSILVKKCQRYIVDNTPKVDMVQKSKLWYHFNSNEKYIEHHNYNLQDKGQGTYSQFVPIQSNIHHSNQITQYFPYIHHLYDINSPHYQFTLFSISTTIQTTKDYQKWKNITKKYLSNLTLEQMFNYYHILLSHGLISILKIKEQRDPLCNFSSFLWRVLEIQRYGSGGSGGSGIKMNPHVYSSMYQGQEISLENISKTMKNLFCSICMIYDCQQHPLPTSAFDHNFQYIKEFDVRHRLENRKRTALELYQHCSIIFCDNQEKKQGEEYCSERCYRRVEKERWKQLMLQRKKRMFSPFFQVIIRMGIQLFHYDPCRIQLLFAKEVKKCDGNTCQEIWSYLLQEYNLIQKMKLKFYDSQGDQLANQFQVLISSSRQQVLKRPIKSKQGKINKDRHQEYNSICLHYFLDKEPTDVSCVSCDCTKRGYCLPSCGCSSQLCSIQRQGCFCKGQNNCWQTKCPCFKSNLICLPQICQNCCGGCNKSNINFCQNNQKSVHFPKFTNIGKSFIQGAGLGLFAGECILKGQFIVRYCGQIVDDNSLQKMRENLVQGNLFYTFKLNKNQSVDSRIFGNKARFINHSKRAANIIPRAMRINQQTMIVFHALRDIYQGEELLFNYNGEGGLSDFKEKYPFID